MQQAAPLGEIRQHWRVIAVSFAMAFFAWGSIFYAHGVFKAALEAKHGWSGLMLSSAQAWFWAVGALTAFGVGAAVDRFGPRAVACYGAYATAIGLTAVGLVTTPWQLFLAYTVLATAYPTIGNLGISAALAPLFQQRYAAALGYALTGASFGGAIVTPVYIWLTATLGFDWASAVIAAATLLCLTPLLRWAPARRVRGSVADDVRGLARFRSALRSRVFWAIWLTGFLSFTGQVGFLFHEISILTPRIGLVMAGYAVSVTVISAAIGRFVVGWAANHVPLGLLAATMYLVQVAGFVTANFAGSIFLNFAAAAIVGFVVGPLVMLPAMLVRTAFGADGFGKTFGVINIGMFAGMTVGPGLAGLVAYQSGYATAIWMFAGCLAAAALVIALGFKPSQISDAL
jgi:predicted MFS family arabinose efflux permease/predicted membrane protein